MQSQFNLSVDYLKVSSIGAWKFILIVDIMHKQQNWYLYNIHDRFRYHQKMLVLARYRYRYQNWCSPILNNRSCVSQMPETMHVQRIMSKLAESVPIDEGAC